MLVQAASKARLDAANEIVTELRALGISISLNPDENFVQKLVQSQSFKTKDSLGGRGAEATQQAAPKAQSR